jgi:two-component system chemotaxis response regulator CheB
MKERIRVLVVDDSALMRKLIPLILERDPDIEVVGTAMDGNFALRKISELQPDVVTLPVIVFSSHSKQGAYATFKALALGAIDFVAKPENAAAGNLETVAAQLVEKIKVAKRAGGPKTLPKPQAELSIQSKKRSRPALPPTRVIAIGISTGGPNALQYTLSQFPADFPAAFIVVQHMPEGFTEMFARRLDECCALDIQEAKSGDLLVAGRVLICPGNRHILARRMPRGEMIVLSDTAPINGHRPSADILFHSVAQEFGPTSVGLIMTGMGEDGAEGLGAIKAAGGLTIAQSEESCVVSGMPRAAIQRGHASKILALEALAPYLIYQFGNDRGTQEKSESPERSEKSEKTEKEKNEKPERSPVSTPGA